MLFFLVLILLQEIVSHKPYPEPDLYHRYDFVKHLEVGSIIEDKPIAFLSNTSFPATLSRSKWVNILPINTYIQQWQVLQNNPCCKNDLTFRMLRNMRCWIMFITAVCILFLIKFRRPKTRVIATHSYFLFRWKNTVLKNEIRTLLATAVALGNRQEPQQIDSNHLTYFLCCFLMGQ